jgi:hypothetical protein
VIVFFKSNTTLERTQEKRGRFSLFLGLFERARMAEVEKIVDAGDIGFAVTEFLVTDS